MIRGGYGSSGGMAAVRELLASGVGGSLGKREPVLGCRASGQLLLLFPQRAQLSSPKCRQNWHPAPVRAGGVR